MPKKLIEVALPLEAINAASAREKSIRHGHPSTLHLWWARRPLAAARAVIFSQMVDDPSEYVDTLWSDPATKREAKSELRIRQKAWLERKENQDEPFRQGDQSSPDPGPEPTLEECAADIERERLFEIIRQLVLWENTTNETVLQAARDEIWQSWRRACAENAGHPRAKDLFDRNKLPAFHDPFAGGGALPLEAQRLGLESYASDLNPVAVLICKAMIEIPPKFAGRPPVNPHARHSGRSEAETRNPVEKLDSRFRGNDDLFVREWKGAQGLAEDVRYYGQWMRDEAEKRIGHLYPKIEVTAEMVKVRPDLAKYVGKSLTVIAWLWARTVKSPNPAFAQVDVPLASTFMLSTKAGKEAYVEPVIENGSYRFTVKVGKPKDAEAAKDGTKLSRGANFQCLMSGAVINDPYIKVESMSGRMGARLMAIVGEGERGRVYLAPMPEHETTARKAKPKWKPDEPMNRETSNLVSGRGYGFFTWADLFTPRQLVALTTFSDLVQEARERVKRDALAARLPGDAKALTAGGTGATAYADAVAVYLGMAISKMSDAQSSLCRWKPTMDQSIATFGRQALPMVWDYSEANVFGEMAGDPLVSLKNMMRVVDQLPANLLGHSVQSDAQSQSMSQDAVVSTDPPYYNNIGYAGISDYFYVWLRRSLKPVFPELFATLAVPKSEELVATPYRHGSKEKAEAFFLEGMTHAMHRLSMQAHTSFPVTVYYAFKQAESEDESGTVRTGWETFLDAVIRAGFAVSGTWPIRTELANKVIGLNANMLASSIILVCRPRAADAPTATRREFVTALKDELPHALAHLQRGNIAPVDLAQAAIGPGMAVYTRYAKVLDAEGKPLTVREALALINHTLDEALAEQEGDFDADSRWALAWFEQSGFAEGAYGVAEVLATAKVTSITGMAEAGILESKRGKVRLLKPVELPADWDPTTDSRLTAWEMVHHLIRTLSAGGESAAAALVAKLGAKAEIAHELAYRLYTLCERKKRAPEALAYNGLVTSWPAIARLARENPPAATQGTDDMFNPG